MKALSYSMDPLSSGEPPSADPVALDRTIGGDMNALNRVMVGLFTDVADSLCRAPTSSASSQ